MTKYVCKRYNMFDLWSIVCWRFQLQKCSNNNNNDLLIQFSDISICKCMLGISMPSITYQSHSINRTDIYIYSWTWEFIFGWGGPTLLSNSIIIQVLNYQPFHLPHIHTLKPKMQCWCVSNSIYIGFWLWIQLVNLPD